MASNQTTAYGLCQWEPGDSFVRAEFNRDNERVEAALHGLEEDKAGRDELAAVEAAAGGKCRMAADYYIGDGAASRIIPVAFPVQAVLVERGDGMRADGGSGVMGGLAIWNTSVIHERKLLVGTTDSGFEVCNCGAAIGDMNLQGVSYHYVAFG